MVFIKRRGLHWENERERVKENYRNVIVYLPDGMAYAFETVCVERMGLAFEFSSFKVPKRE